METRKSLSINSAIEQKPFYTMDSILTDYTSNFRGFMPPWMFYLQTCVASTKRNIDQRMYYIYVM